MSLETKSRFHYLFHAIALLIPVVFFILLELGLRVFDYGDDLRLFIPVPSNYGNQEYLGVNPNVAKRYFPAGYYTPAPAEELFRKHKPENGYRVFVMGGSTAASWPYPNNVLFSRILAQRLADAFPERYIEVVNTGIAAVNSFTLLDFSDEILEQQPDAILIYSGHNEFYGALGAGSTQTVGQSRWLIQSYLALSKFKLFQLMRTLVDGAKGMWAGQGGLSSHSTLMGQMVGNNSIAYGSEIYLNARHNFEANLAEILTKAKSAGVEVMLSELVSNLRDHPPFISVDDGTHLPAELIYEWARQLDQQGMYGMAREAYTLAKDLDGLRFRASEEFNQSIHKVAAQFDVPVVPMKAYFEKTSPNGIIGKELMLEHLHPSADGYLLMSEAFFHTMHEQGFLAKQWPAELLPDRYYRDKWPITALDRALGEIRIINLTDHYPYKPKGPGQRTMANYVPQNIVEELALKTYQDEIGYAEAHITLARHLESQNQLDAAFREYQALIAAVPFNVENYLIAADFLLKQREFENALPLLRSSMDVQETGYANKWIGQILLLMQQPQQARKYLEAALIYAPEDPQLIYNVGFVKLAQGDVEGARQSMSLLQRIAPESPQLQNMQQAINQYEQQQGQAPD